MDRAIRTANILLFPLALFWNIALWLGLIRDRMVVVVPLGMNGSGKVNPGQPRVECDGKLKEAQP